MQRIFIDLLKAKNPVATTDLTTCFGWSKSECSNIHQDTGEFFIKLIEILDKELPAKSNIRDHFL
jgi:hypothetical protein